jgi:hypothetical protein
VVVPPPLRAALNKRGSRRRTQTNVCRATVLTTNPNPDPISEGAVVRGNCLQRRRCHRCPHRHRHLLCTKHRLKHRCLFPGNRSQSRTMIGGACHLWLWAPFAQRQIKGGAAGAHKPTFAVLQCSPQTLTPTRSRRALQRGETAYSAVAVTAVLTDTVTTSTPTTDSSIDGVFLQHRPR